MHCYSLHFNPTDAECQEVRRLLDEVMLTRTRQMWDYQTVTAPLLAHRPHGFSWSDLAGMIDPTAAPLDSLPPETIRLRDFIDAITPDEDPLSGDDVEELIDLGCFVQVPRFSGAVVDSDTYCWRSDEDREAVRSLRDRIDAAYEKPGYHEYHFANLLSYIGFGLAEAAAAEEAMMSLHRPDPDEPDPLQGFGEALAYLEQRKARYP